MLVFSLGLSPCYRVRSRAAGTRLVLGRSSVAHQVWLDALKTFLGKKVNQSLKFFKPIDFFLHTVPTVNLPLSGQCLGSVETGTSERKHE